MKILPRFRAATHLKLYAESNNWDETDSKQLVITDCPLRTRIYTNDECLNCVDSSSIIDDGLAFTRAADFIVFRKGHDLMKYKVNVDLTIGDESSTLFPNDDQWDLVPNNPIPYKRPSNSRAALFPDPDNPTILALSNPYDDPYNAGLAEGTISLYTSTGNNSNSVWQITDVLNGHKSNQRLGLKSLKFIDVHLLEAVSGDSKYDYFAQSLVSIFYWRCKHYLFFAFI